MVRCLPIAGAGGQSVGFEKIGPYELTRSDLLIGSLVISFRIGSVATRVSILLLTLVALVALVLGALVQEFLVTGIGAFWLFFIFGLPLLRSRKNSREIYLEQDPMGLAIETPMARVLYKWPAIRKVEKVGSRLFVMISSRTALVIPDRVTSPGNMEALVATIADNRPG
jgi:hypothetical protein